MAPSVDVFTLDLEAWEGNVDHMYRGTRGFVTVGKGSRLRPKTRAPAPRFLGAGVFVWAFALPLWVLPRLDEQEEVVGA